jgi:hypothetical protein
MSDRPRVYAVCSFDKGFSRVVEHLRQQYPHGEITAVLPRGQQLTASELKHIDHVLESSARTLSAVGGLLGLIRLARTIRATQAEEVVFQFESAKLRLFGIACRPRRCTALLGNGQRLPLSLSLAETLGDLYRHRLRGYTTTLTAAWHAYGPGTAKEAPERAKRGAGRSPK